MQFSKTIYVEEDYKFIVAISMNSNNIFIFPTNDIGRPIISNFPTAQRMISSLVYSPKSDFIITIGETIKVWNLKVIQNTKVIHPSVIITHQTTFKGSFHTALYSSIGFDEEREFIFLPIQEGVCPYTIQGELLPYTIQGEHLPMSTKVATNMPTLFTFSNKPKEILTSDPINCLSLWSSIGTLVKRITYGGSSINFMMFIDDENVLIV